MAYLASKELISLIRSRIEQSVDANTNSNHQRALAYQQFFLEPNGTEGAGRSQIQSADVNSMITAVCAQMVISFSTDTVVEYEANSAEDEQAAKAESTAVNKIAVEDNGGFRVMLAGIQNALMYRNGYIKVWWDKDQQRYTVRHSDVERADLPFVAANDQPGIERRLISYNAETKVARVEVTETKKRLRVQATANERFFYDPEWNEPTLEGCPIVGEIHYKTRDELVRMGCDKEVVKDLPATQRYTGIENSQKLRGRNTAGGEIKPIGHAMDVIRVYEAYVYYPESEDDDYAYLHKCWLGDSGDEWLMEPDIVDRNPYAMGTAFPVANMTEGESLSEKLYWIQEGKTELFRQWIDNVRNCVWGRPTVLSGQVNGDDLMEPGAGKPIRAKRIDAVQWNVIPDVGASINMAMEKLDEMRAERGGASVDMVGAEMQLANDTAHGTERVYAAKELLVSYMTRNLAESLIREMYLKAHAELRGGGTGPIPIKIADQWTEVDPATWQPRMHCNVTVGYSMGERMHMSQVLGSSLQNYAQLLQAYEGELVSKAGFYKMMNDYLNLNLIDNPQAYFIDPESPGALQAGQQKAQATSQAQQQALDAANAVEELKASIEQYKTDNELQFKYFDAVLKAQMESQRTEADATTSIIQARSDAEVAKAGGGNGNGAASGSNRNGADRNGGRNRKQPSRANGASDKPN